MNASMVSDHIVETEKLNGLHRSEYEKALKYTSASSLISKTSLTRRNEFRILSVLCLRSFCRYGLYPMPRLWMHYLPHGPQTSSTLMAFTLAMVENPHTRKHAQEDIDAVRTDHTCHMLTQSYGRY